MSYDSKQNGTANYQSFMHVPDSSISGMVEGANTQALKLRKYAQLVYQVNDSSSAPITISGEVDTKPVVYSSLIRVSGDLTWIMKTPPGVGALSGDAVWQIKKIEAVGDNYDITWADGNENFDNIAANYASLTYSL